MEWVKCSDQMPKAEQFVLAYFKNEYGKDRRIRAFYAPRYTVETGVDNDWYEYKPEDMEGADDTAYLPEGWYEANEYEDTHWHVTDEITHWVPLPEPPSNAIGQGSAACGASPAPKGTGSGKTTSV